MARVPSSQEFRTFMKINAKRIAKSIVDGGVSEAPQNGARPIRVSDAYALRALQRGIREFLRNDCRRRTIVLTKREGMGFPTGLKKSKTMDRCYLTIDLDLDGCVSWITTWASGDVDEVTEKALVESVAQNPFDDWCATHGFGWSSQMDGDE